MSLLMVSCKSLTTVTITGKPGTEIYDMSFQKLGTLDTNGQLNYTFDKSNFSYDNCFFSVERGSGYMVPFGIDYDKVKHSGTNFGKGMFWTLFGGGAYVELMGVIAYAAGAGDVGLGMALGGVGAMLCSLPFMGSMLKENADIYKHNFELTKTQQTNQDIPFVKPEFQSTDRSIKATPAAIATEDAAPASTASSKSLKKTTSKSSKKLKSDSGAALEGTYVGKGTLKLGYATIEKYTDIQVVVKRLSDAQVAVNVVEKSGDKYFDDDSTYNIVKESDGSYTLELEDIPDATIIIDAKGNLKYNHPRVNIEDSIYQLAIDAAK